MAAIHIGAKESKESVAVSRPATGGVTETPFGCGGV